MKKRGVIINTVFFLFIAMFTYAAASKWMMFNVFVSQMHKQPFNDKYTPLLVWGIPTSEIIVTLMMMLDKTRVLALKIATAMMILFTGYIILIELNLFGKIPCACGGAIAELSWTQHLFFNLFFVFAGVLAIFLIRKNRYSTE